MQRLLFGIFAHPDDEAFGPAATLMKAADEGIELHLICLTNGQNGTNPDNAPDLGKVRKAEWRAAGKLIGAQHMHALNYTDGTLCNSLYHDIAAQLAHIVRKAAAKHKVCEISFVTFDPNGLTGHLDHIAASLITTYSFYKLKDDPPAGVTVRELAYYCTPLRLAPKPSTEYVFMPAGRPANYINRKVNVSKWFDRKITVINAHQSQRHDAQNLLANGANFHATDYFHVIA